jgi:hypothetical protein
MHSKVRAKTLDSEYNLGIRTCHINKRNKQFYIIRYDGTIETFSYYKAISDYQGGYYE